MQLATLLRVLRLRRRLRQHERSDRAELEQHQERALHQLRQHAYARSAFYRRFHRGSESRPLHELPVLTKADLMEHFDGLVVDPEVRLSDVLAYLERGSDRPYLDRYVVSAMSGSTGRRGVFLADRDEWNRPRKGTARATGRVARRKGIRSCVFIDPSPS